MGLWAGIGSDLVEGLQVGGMGGQAAGAVARGTAELEMGLKAGVLRPGGAGAAGELQRAGCMHVGRAWAGMRRGEDRAYLDWVEQVRCR